MLHCIEKKGEKLAYTHGNLWARIDTTEVVNFLSSFLPYKEHNAAALLNERGLPIHYALKGSQYFKKQFFDFPPHLASNLQQLDLPGPVLNNVLICLISIFQAAKKVQGKKLGNLRRLKVLHDRKLILNDWGGHLVSFRTFRCPLFPNLVSCPGLFLPLHTPRLL